MIYLNWHQRSWAHALSLLWQIAVDFSWIFIRFSASSEQNMLPYRNASASAIGLNLARLNITRAPCDRSSRTQHIWHTTHARTFPNYLIFIIGPRRELAMNFKRKMQKKVEHAILIFYFKLIVKCRWGIWGMHVTVITMSVSQANGN